MPMYWTFNCFLGCIYTVYYIVHIVFSVLNWLSNLEFRLPKENVFFSLTPSLISYKVKCCKFIGLGLSGIDLFHLLYLPNTNWSPFHHSSLGLPLAMPLGSQLRSSSFLLRGRFTADDSLLLKRIFFWNF